MGIRTILGLALVVVHTACGPYPYGQAPGYGAPPPAQGTPQYSPPPPQQGYPAQPPQQGGAVSENQGWAPPSAPQQSPSPQAAWQPPPQAAPVAMQAPASAPPPADCSAVCTHYLRCKMALSPQNLSACIPQCVAVGSPAPLMAYYVTTDCPTAIALLENPPSGNQAPAQPQGGARDPACNGCVWDGSSCIWLSQSNWGPGPYSGAAADCKPSCCGR
jgi:hypothetical protein